MYVGTKDKSVYGLMDYTPFTEIHDPFELPDWKYNIGALESDVTYSTPALARDHSTLYIGSLNNKLYALYTDGSSTEGDSKTEKWTFETEGDINGKIVVGLDDTVYFRSNDGHVYGVAPDGTEKFHFSPGVDFDPTLSTFFNPVSTVDDTVSSVGDITIGSEGTLFFAVNNGTDSGLVYAVAGCGAVWGRNDTMPVVDAD